MCSTLRLHEQNLGEIFFSSPTANRRPASRTEYLHPLLYLSDGKAKQGGMTSSKVHPPLCQVLHLYFCEMYYTYLRAVRSPTTKFHGWVRMRAECLSLISWI